MPFCIGTTDQCFLSVPLSLPLECPVFRQLPAAPLLGLSRRDVLWSYRFQKEAALVHLSLK